jgi:predicted DCC family thiol-disulfide oxidoreductase YuxK
MRSNRRFEEKLLVIFDDHCVLCNSFARFVARQDHKKIIQFTQRSQSKIQTESIVVIHKGIEYTQTKAIITILKSFSIFWRFIAGIINFFPLSITDFFYRKIARNRKRWWGEQKECTTDVGVRERMVW